MRRRLCLLLVLLGLTAAAPLAAQTPRPPAARDTSTAVPDTTTHGVKPRTAFLRSLIIPGWGQASVHAWGRAGAFVALQSTSWYMLVKTLNKLSDANKRADNREKFATDSVTDALHVSMSKDTALNRRLSNPDSFRIALNTKVDADSAVVATRALVNSREQQRQDWITYVLFTTLASGVDAFVAAHLADFPATISTRRESNGAYQLKLTVPFPRRP